MVQLRANRVDVGLLQSLRQRPGNTEAVTEVGAVQEDAGHRGETHGTESRQALPQDVADLRAALPSGLGVIGAEGQEELLALQSGEGDQKGDLQTQASQVQKGVGKARQDVGGGDA